MAQGRPMGLLVALLQFPCTGHVAAHRDAMTSFDHDVRLTARLGAVHTGDCTDLFSCERPPNSGDTDGEPRVAP